MADKRQYRYTGADKKHRVDNRTLRKGEIVELDESQARAFKDRFTLVGGGKAVPESLTNDNFNAIDAGGDDKIPESEKRTPGERAHDERSNETTELDKIEEQEAEETPVEEEEAPRSRRRR
jgi:hypothetical protein